MGQQFANVLPPSSLRRPWARRDSPPRTDWQDTEGLRLFPNCPPWSEVELQRLMVISAGALLKKIRENINVTLKKSKNGEQI